VCGTKRRGSRGDKGKVANIVKAGLVHIVVPTLLLGKKSPFWSASIDKNADLVVYSTHMHNDFPTELANRWPEFVLCERRIEGLKRLFEEMLWPGSHVLDAAAGTGCDANWLGRHGYQVTANEISPEMRVHFPNEIRDSETRNIHVTSVNWFDFVKVLPQSYFDATLLLGNSLCLLEDSNLARQAIKGLVYVTRKGGRIIIDERNFRFMLENRELVLSDTWRTDSKVMYCGTKIRAKPTAIGERTMSFGYFDSGDGRLIGVLKMYAFERNEIVQMCEAEGLKLFATYSDLIPGIDALASVYTYVFDK
jgi:SAM-dependent methyltransferase